MDAFPLIDIVAAGIDRAGTIAHDHILVPHAQRLDQRGAGDGRGAGAVHHHPHLIERAPRQMAGIEQAGGGDDRGAVLIVMHHRDLHPLAQRLFDDEALRGLDVLQIDPAEARLHQRDRVDEGLRVFGVEFQVDRIDIGETLEQHRLAFHHRLRRQRAQIAEAKDGRAVGDHRDQIGPGGVARGERGVFGDGQHRDGDAGGIGQAQVALRRHRLAGDHLDLTGPDRLMVEQRLTRGKFIRLLIGQCVLPLRSSAPAPP